MNITHRLHISSNTGWSRNQIRHANPCGSAECF